MTHLYSKFQFKMSICNGDNEQKLKIIGIFLSPRGIALPKIIRLAPLSNSTCVLSWHIYVPNFNSKCQFVMEIMSGNCKLLEFFLDQGAKVCRKLFDWPKYRTQPLYSRDNPMYQTSFENLKVWQRKWAETESGRMEMGNTIWRGHKKS